MATARELLEQADALMRRNRLRGAATAALAAESPVLAEVASAGAATPANDTHGDLAAGAAADATQDFAATATDAHAESAQPAPRRDAIDDFDDFPVLTDIVSDPEPISVIGATEDGGEPSVWPEDPLPPAGHDGWSARADALDADVDAANAMLAPAILEPPATESAAAESDMAEAESTAEMRAEPAEDTSPTEPVRDDTILADAMPQVLSAGIGDAIPHDAVESAVAIADTREVAEIDDAAPTSGAAGAAERARREALAEEVRIQVLQRLDIFTDTGLQEQLTARLTPIVDRASADLVAAINQHLGALLRAYVAEAIEREIEKLRHDDAL